MKCLGIESTAHTFGISIIEDKKEIATASHTFTTEEGGMIPMEVQKHHLEFKDKLLKQVLDESKLELKDLDLISFSKGPGLPPSLVVGKDFAVKLAKENNVPLIGVNHICAHLEIGRMITKTKDPVFVFVSGANTQIIAHEGGRYRVFGEALSIALGNALDKFGRIIGLGFPAGPKIEQLAKKGQLLDLPYVVKGMDVDFSGIITKAEQLFKKGVKKEDLCFSLQETCFAMLTEVTERALAHCDKNECILIGGVAANQRFCEMLNDMCEDRNAKFYPVPLKYCGDNPIMIAWQGILEYKSTKRLEDLEKVDINPVWRIDEVEATWY
ncbi:MAG: tRNA (adenosine(37)-N6)-threonylcarbamoyltransferase complex transferase subunit TsaD [Nanoarchaeota archaeon]|nr:tRNA (adenosine(37)-N6)-threonylcarbamoyltransferase complex transferase subunit TsaD [Nanoarchaeota archaeon]